MTLSFRIATPLDTEPLRFILETSDLSAHGILEVNTRYWLALADDQPVGCIGLEFGAVSALLRSAAVLPNFRGQGIGSKLLETALIGARAAQKRSVYLFSTEAGSYWLAQGFVNVPVPEVVAALSAAPQVRHYEALGWLPTEVAYRFEVNP